MLVERGFDEASMDDVAAAAGTTKPTVYAHFGSKEELFSAVIQLLRDMFHERMGDPDEYGADPIQAITGYCGRILQLISWQDGLGFQRLVIANAPRSREMAREVYSAFFGSAIDALTAYLERHGLAMQPAAQAERILAATVALPLLRYLYGLGLDAVPTEPPGDRLAESRFDAHKLRETVSIFLTR